MARVRLLVPLTALVGAVMVVTVVSVPSAAASPPPPLGPVPVEGTSVSSGEALSTTTVPAARADAALETGRVVRDLAPGLTLTEFDRYDPRGWLRGDVLTADLAGSGLRVEHIEPDRVAERTVLPEQAAPERAVAAVNGDFFDIGATGAPLGVGLDRVDGLRHAPASGWNRVAGIGPDGLGRLTELLLDASVTLPGAAPIRASGLNTPTVPANGIGVYTPLWGPASREPVVDGATATEVVLRGGVVTTVTPGAGTGPVAADTVVLVGRDDAARTLGELSPGDRVAVSYAPRVADGGPLDVAISGNRVLARDGVAAPLDDTVTAPRTAVGFSADGTRMWLVTVDGRQAASRGTTDAETARLLLSLGADDVLNLDGGGSSTLLARYPGESATRVRNSPSDGVLRPVPNGLGLTVGPGSGALSGIRVAPSADRDGADRVLGGLTRDLVGFGHDETGTPVSVDPRWSTRGTGTVQVRENGPLATVRGGAPGMVAVLADDGAVRGETALRVLGEPVRLATDTARLELTGRGAQGTVALLGYDADGFGTWVTPTDAQVEHGAAVAVTRTGDGFRISATRASGSAVVTLRVGGLVTRVGVVIGSRSELVDGLDGTAGWAASAFPSGVGAALSDTPGRDGGTALALDYALTGSTATRAAYANATPPIALPAGAQRVGMWVRGDGRGAWLRITLLDPAGTAATLTLAQRVDWTGWRFVEAVVPPGLGGPLRVQRIYPVETDGSRQYSGTLAFDDLTVAVAPAITVPPSPAVVDPAVLAVTAPPPGTRIAVVSDAQFTADEPDGPLVDAARRTLREAVAARPDVVVIAGDLVDRGSAADLALARRVITEELDGRVRWHYVPGNHELSGPGDVSAFRAEFGAPARVVDVAGTRLVLLDSSTGTLRGGGFDQVRMLRDALDSAATDPAVHSVVVAAHHPVRDPSPTANSQLGDRLEADLLVDWLAGFEAASGKPAASIAAHAGLSHISRVDGVPLVINPNAGKGPSAAPDAGGFTGWTLVVAGPQAGRDGVRVQTRPRVDDLVLDVPGVLTVGQSAPLDGEVRQGQRIVPLRHPVSASVTGSPGVVVTATPGPDAVLAVHPDTGLLTALAPGTVRLTVEVNGVLRSATITVTG